MKEVKTIIVTCAVIGLVLLVAGLGYKLLSDKDLSDSQVQTEQAMANLRDRVEQLTVLRQEQLLIRDITLFQQEIKELNLKAKTSGSLVEEIQD